ncbi:quinate utilization oxidoreductase QutH [Xylariales sp. PMI_506]|nr:quinate utilization oxidoreductase QutH [Xylariales sp. PMI_506]
MASSNSPPPVKFAIIGFSGLIGVRHLDHVLKNPSTELVALIDPAPVAKGMAEEKGIPYFASIGAMLQSPDVARPDAAIVCTPNHTHIPLALELVEAGIHVLVEKPLSTDAISGASLVLRAKEKGVQVLVGHHRRFNPYVVATKQAIESGLVGDITAMSALWTAYKPEPYFTSDPKSAWRSSKKDGGGVVLINLVHEIDILQYLFGPIVRVHAEKTLTRRGDEPDRAEEGAVMTMRFSNGIVGTMVLSDAVVSPHFFEAGTGENPMLPVAHRQSGEEIDVYRVFGTKGTLSVPDMTHWGYGTDAPNWTSEIIPTKITIDDDPRPPFERQLDHFIGVVRGSETPRCSGEEGLRAVVVCDAVRRALDDPSGTVTIDEDITHI